MSFGCRHSPVTSRAPRAPPSAVRGALRSVPGWCCSAVVSPPHLSTSMPDQLATTTQQEETGGRRWSPRRDSPLLGRTATSRRSSRQARGAGGAAASGGPAQRQLTTVTTLSRCPRPPAGTQRGGTAHRAEMWYGYGVILGCGGRISFAHGWLLGCCRSRQAAIGRPSVHQYACRCQRVEMKGPRWRPRCNHHLQQMSLPLPDLHSPVLLADHRGRTPPLCLDVLGAP
ncbi:hypothetical protein VFPFJ_03866 [Purpureocillium lilacinum]|uniref:Uncharacterized protein n=1 Tax=Purpureocillium lilacinum TaxID=33203 RepID=A0A179HNW2_PURLI|nr:hypothetical protein VFPFJ_03866 [Purpureocillium lilacinum]OAQ92126.1 hypothetical protein VFPFJ_03866 [Purpureocillium lilacinum]